MSGIRARQKRATQERVLQAARTLFLTRPYEDVGERDIAAEAGVATGTVIGAFGSKAGLPNTIVPEDIVAQYELIKVAVVGQQAVVERLMAIGMTCVNYQGRQLPLLRTSSPCLGTQCRCRAPGVPGAAADPGVRARGALDGAVPGRHPR